MLRAKKTHRGRADRTQCTGRQPASKRLKMSSDSVPVAIPVAMPAFELPASTEKSQACDFENHYTRNPYKYVSDDYLSRAIRDKMNSVIQILDATQTCLRKENEASMVSDVLGSIMLSTSSRIDQVRADIERMHKEQKSKERSLFQSLRTKRTLNTSEHKKFQLWDVVDVFIRLTPGPNERNVAPLTWRLGTIVGINWSMWKSDQIVWITVQFTRHNQEDINVQLVSSKKRNQEAHQWIRPPPMRRGLVPQEQIITHFVHVFRACEYGEQSYFAP